MTIEIKSNIVFALLVVTERDRSLGGRAFHKQEFLEKKFLVELLNEISSKNTFGVKKVQPSKVESYPKVNT